MFNIMVSNSSMKDRSNCFVKMVGSIYSVSYGKIIPQIYLIFKSKEDYDKIK